MCMRASRGTASAPPRPIVRHQQTNSMQIHKQQRHWQQQLRWTRRPGHAQQGVVSHVAAVSQLSTLTYASGQLGSPSFQLVPPSRFAASL
jgi:hypothetical protein